MIAFKKILELALSEDLGELGDVTSKAIFSDEKCKAVLLSKSKGILAGQDCFIETFASINSEIIVKFSREDGNHIDIGEDVAVLEGSVSSLLAGERTAINFLAYLSGIATSASQFCKAVEKNRATVLDTRKTLPGYRELAKYAVRMGGASNHRMGLYDMIMIKDNHIDAAGSIKDAIEKVRDFWGSKFRIEVEARNIDEVRQAVEARVDVIMLDNMDVPTCTKALSIGAGKVLFEASGNMNIDKVVKYADIGIDCISVGAITHSAVPLDFSMRIIRNVQ